jgi:hypothetical protein
MLSALGPVTTTFAVGESGSTPPVFCSSVIHCRADRSVAPRPAVTAASAALASMHGVLGSRTHGWSNRPSRNFIVRMRRTASLMRDMRILPSLTSARMAAWKAPLSKGSIDMSTPALTAFAIAPGKSAATW